jgi:hypothetical protein
MTDSAEKAPVDERKIARGVAVGLPIVTVTIALAVGVIANAATAILVLAAGALLGVIALFWASLRILSGDAALPAEIEALDRTAHGVDALASRRKMLLRALKDLENERALGKLDAEDFEQVAETYRADLKDVLRKIDTSLEPFRDKAEALARSHLAAVGLTETAYRGSAAPAEAAAAPGAPAAKESSATAAATKQPPADEASSEPRARVECATCKASNEPDAKFCKGCGSSLAPAGDAGEPAVAEPAAKAAEEPSSDED